jgi:hypothetical protein
MVSEEIELLLRRGLGSSLSGFKRGFGLAEPGFGFGGVLLPKFTFAAFGFGVGDGQQARGFGFLPGEAGLCFVVCAGADLGAELFKFGGEGGSGVDGHRRWDEGAGLELGSPSIGAMEPDGGLAGDFQGSEGLARGALVLVRRGITDTFQVIEELGGLLGQDRFESQRAEDVVEACAIAR